MENNWKRLKRLELQLKIYAIAEKIRGHVRAKKGGTAQYSTRTATDTVLNIYNRQRGPENNSISGQQRVKNVEKSFGIKFATMFNNETILLIIMIVYKIFIFTQKKFVCFP